MLCWFRILTVRVMPSNEKLTDDEERAEGNRVGTAG
jgi:hypothetical protein